MLEARMYGIVSQVIVVCALKYVFVMPPLNSAHVDKLVCTSCVQPVVSIIDIDRAHSQKGVLRLVYNSLGNLGSPLCPFQINPDFGFWIFHNKEECCAPRRTLDYMAKVFTIL